MKKFTYNDWWDGKICLDVSPHLYENEIESKNPLSKVKWTDIEEADILLIKEKQKRLFQEQANNLVKELKEEFWTDYKNSKARDVLVKIKQQEIKDKFYSEQGDLQEAINYKNDMRDFYRYYFVRGRGELGFIHSPTCQYKPYKKYKNPPQVYAQALLDFRMWLKKLKTNKKNNAIAKPPLKLSDIFESISKHTYIMDLLVEKKHCQSNTYIWKDEGKGNKGFLVALLKFLHTQQYYKGNKRPTNKQIMEIAKNSFGWKIGIDTIKKAKPKNFDLSFIPPASTVK